MGEREGRRSSHQDLTWEGWITFCMLRANIERATLSLAFPCAIALTFDRSLLANKLFTIASYGL